MLDQCRTHRCDSEANSSTQPALAGKDRHGYESSSPLDSLDLWIWSSMVRIKASILTYSSDPGPTEPQAVFQGNLSRNLSQQLGVAALDEFADRYGAFRQEHIPG